MRISSTLRSHSRTAPKRPTEKASKPSDRVAWSIAGSSATGFVAGAVSLSGSTTADKFRHIGVSAAATMALGAVGVRPSVAAGTVFIGATVGKELIMDLALGMGTPSILDATANLAGVLAGYAALQALQHQPEPKLQTKWTTF